MQPDIIVIGGGTVGAAIAYGLARTRQRVLLLDGDDGDFRAARANFGLVWLQGKGLGMPAYQALTRDSIALWRGFTDELEAETEIDLTYEQKGGLAFCLGEDGFEKRRHDLMRLHNQSGDGRPDWEMLDRAALERLVPKASFGRNVTGASFGRHDGHTNPLRLLAALHGALPRHGGAICHRARVERIEPVGPDFRLILDGETLVAPRIVIAAGLGSPALARQVGLEVPLRPERGQVLVTERLEPFLPLPASGLRQTGEGTVMIGATKDDNGFDVSTTAEAAAWLSRKTVEIVPALAGVRLVRQWAGLRIMTPDGYPIYAQSQSHPGAFVALCHSGVTLAAFHAETLAGAIAAGSLPNTLSPFHQRRFDVPQAA
ncbi:FAD-dependent oxidoreductase [Bosea sp. 124]|uniref:NAD(P)/FAD-dependent oxidoreductase n=1 Tax=Bosea sp. 124 TaxID=2135642 RepID=UPI000D36ABD4|nr:FAD-dependent oxidoreductase [Bosea sp. 124]PTM41441.1 glycine/D-amino acid oxidase-like deaminating enzyme [Bosea sp. 124]